MKMSEFLYKFHWNMPQWSNYKLISIDSEDCLAPLRRQANIGSNDG